MTLPSARWAGLGLGTWLQQHAVSRKSSSSEGSWAEAAGNHVLGQKTEPAR